MDLPRRKPTRLKNFDYGNGACFVTICTQDKKCILSDITVGEGLAPPETRLTPHGVIAEEQLFALETRYPSVRIEKYVIMPNHIHAIIRMQGDRSGTGGSRPSPTLFDVVRVFKSMTARRCREIIPGLTLWQRSFHDHVIRNDDDYREIWQYIDNNPAKWAQDRFYTK